MISFLQDPLSAVLLLNLVSQDFSLIKSWNFLDSRSLIVMKLYKSSPSESFTQITFLLYNAPFSVSLEPDIQFGNK